VTEIGQFDDPEKAEEIAIESGIGPEGLPSSVVPPSVVAVQQISGPRFPPKTVTPGVGRLAVSALAGSALAGSLFKSAFSQGARNEGAHTALEASEHSSGGLVRNVHSALRRPLLSGFNSSNEVTIGKGFDYTPRTQRLFEEKTGELDDDPQSVSGTKKSRSELVRSRKSSKAVGSRNSSKAVRPRNNSKAVGSVAKHERLRLAHRKMRHSHEKKTLKNDPLFRKTNVPEIKKSNVKVMDVQAEILALNGGLNELRRTNASRDAHVGALEASVRDLQITQEQQSAKIGQDFAHLEGNIAKLNGDYEKLEGLLSELSKEAQSGPRLPESEEGVEDGEPAQTEPESENLGFFGRLRKSFKNAATSAKNTLIKNRRAFEELVLLPRITKGRIPFNEKQAIYGLIDLIHLKIRGEEPTEESGLKQYYDSLNVHIRNDNGAKPFQSTKQFQALRRSLQQLEQLAAQVKVYEQKKVTTGNEFHDILTRMRTLIGQVERADELQNIGTQNFAQSHSNKVRKTRRPWFGGKKKTRSNRRRFV
jgi:hypothetical protein